MEEKKKGIVICSVLEEAIKKLFREQNLIFEEDKIKNFPQTKCGSNYTKPKKRKKKK